MNRKQEATDLARRQADQLARSEHFVGDFAGDPPHEAAGGEYAFCVRDRWFGVRPGLRDGWHAAAGWAIRIRGGLPSEALRADHPRFRAVEKAIGRRVKPAT